MVTIIVSRMKLQPFLVRIVSIILVSIINDETTNVIINITVEIKYIINVFLLMSVNKNKELKRTINPLTLNFFRSK